MVGCTVSYGNGFALFQQNVKNGVWRNKLCRNRKAGRTPTGREINLTRPLRILSGFPAGMCRRKAKRSMSALWDDIVQEYGA